MKSEQDSSENQHPVGRTAATSMYEQLRDDILSGELMPGAQLKLDQLKSRYDAGASPIREALNRLSEQGVVVREDLKGFKVPRVSESDYQELIESRCMLEEVALRKSIEIGNDDWEERIVLAQFRMSKVSMFSVGKINSPDPQWETLHKEFHQSLISACGSSWIMNYCQQLSDLSIRYLRLAMHYASPRKGVDTEHEKIVEATLARDTESAVQLLVDHYRSTGDDIRTAIKSIASG